MAFADSASQTVNQPDNPWTDCGIGYALFRDSEVGAAISNVIWDAGTTATTTYLSSPDSCRPREAKVAQFISESYDSLENETAVGAGAHLQALTEISNCPADEHDFFVASIREDFSTLASQEDFNRMNRAQKSEVYFEIVIAHINGRFAEVCNTI